MAQKVSTGEEVVVVPAAQMGDTAQSPGNMVRRAGIAGSNAGSKAIWLGRSTMQPKGYSGAHHHAHSETAGFVLKGTLRVRYGPNLERTAEAKEGDFIYIPAHVLHQEINPDDSEAEAIIARSHYDNIVVNVDMPESVVRPPGL